MSTVQSAPHHAPLDHALELLERAIGYTRVQLQVVTPAMLCRPTPCAAWTLAGLLDHMADSLDTLTEAADLGTVVLASNCAWAATCSAGIGSSNHARSSSAYRRARRMASDSGKH